MARRRIKRIHPSQPMPQNASPKRIPTGLLVSGLLTLVLGGIPFAMGRYIELKSPDPFDSGAYVYSAEHLLQGARLGVEESPSAYPIILLTNILGVKLFGFNETGPKILQAILQLSALTFMFYTLRRIFGSIAAITATTVAAIYLSAPLIAKFGNVKEQYMIAFAIGAVCSFLLYESSAKRYWLCACGFFAVLPFYCKATGISVVVAIVAYLLIQRSLNRQWKILLIDFLLFLGGITVGLTIPASLFIWQKRLDMFQYTFPVIAVQMFVVLLGVIAALVYAVSYIRKIHLLSRLKQVRKSIWLSGGAVLLITLILSVTAVAAAEQFFIKQSDYSAGAVQNVSSYLRDIPVISVPATLYRVSTGSFRLLFAAAGLKGGYVENSWKAITFSKLAPQIFRYYKALSVPILLALGSLLTAVCIRIPGVFRKSPAPNDIPSRTVWMLVLWWIADMLLVWISPHSYEQYYLPLCASGAVLGSFIVWKWQQKLAAAKNKIPWIMTGAVAAVILSGLSVPIFIGQRYSPDTNDDYIARYGYRRRGFTEALERVKADTIAPWQAVSDYIRSHSGRQDTIYVWGWVPGIYVRAQRMAPVPTAYEGSMHITPPAQLAGLIQHLVGTFEQNPPKYIVDTRKIHFPNDRPPLELWPHTYSEQKPTGQPIPNNPQIIAQYDQQYKKLLAEQFDPSQKEYANLPGLTSWIQYAPWAKAMPDEAQRYEAMKPFRDYVMNHYTLINGQFGTHVLFERK